MSGERRIAVLIATYQRPASLALLLDRLVPLVQMPPEDWHVAVLVCDNDPAASARSTCTGHPLAPTYLHEPRPGIAAARNALVEAATAVDAIAFIDDDEWPEPKWLDALISAYLRFEADVVTGVVVSEFESPPPPWLVPSFARPRQPTGTAVTWPRTGNVLIRRSCLESPPLRFRDSYGLSGGSDSMLFLELARREATMIWADDAIVHERVPADRMALRWVLRRAFRLGNTHTRFDRDLDGSFRTMVLRAGKAIGWMGRGMLNLGRGLAQADRGTMVLGLEQLWRGSGMIAGLGGIRFLEYRRFAS